MQHYPTDSPQAAARILALTVLADGAQSPLEVRALHRLDACRKLSLTQKEWHSVVAALCRGLLAAARTRGETHCTVTPEQVSAWLREVQDPVLRAEVLGLCAAVAEADDYLADSEWTVLAQALSEWNLHRTMLPGAA